MFYANRLLDHNPNSHWFDIYEATIDQLSFWGAFDVAGRWIDLADDKTLRLRYRERLEELRKWSRFLRAKSTVAD